ncbi:dynein regulatory complex subunit 5-like [Rhopilema esculentum]|uniref:dynein regulatory complex subunit 5-like n=1 Tax=Rhopilema esculentum TaxID=499914 RepID=UPI0031CF0FDD|eukprot:gene13241-4067_t
MDKTLNPAADPRQMRRIIAEDPEWNLATVPLLTELCLQHIVDKFEGNPVLHDLLPKHKTKVLENLSPKLPLSVTANLVQDNGYWKKCCRARWNVCDVSLYNDNWKQMYFERNLEEIIEKFVPGTTDPSLLEKTLKLSSDYIKSINIKQLLPPVKEPPIRDEDEDEDSGSESGDTLSIDHFDFNVVTQALPFLRELRITYGVRDCGMNFEWNLFEFTSRDCLLLAKAIKSCDSLITFQLHQSKVDDEKCRVLISHLLDHPTLKQLDLSHNKIGDSGARAIGKLINGRCRLEELDLRDNKIKALGAAAIGHGLGKNSTLAVLSLRLNRLGDEGGQAVCKALLKNTTLKELDIGSNDLGEPTAALLSKVLAKNKVIKRLNLSCNKIGQDGGISLQEGMEENSTLTHMDLRLTEVGQECEYCINQLIRGNVNKEHLHRK